VFLLRTMAGLTIHTDVLAGVFDLNNIDMTILAGFVAGVVDRTGRNLRQSIAPEVPVLPKATGHQYVSHQQKERESREKDSR